MRAIAVTPENRTVSIIDQPEPKVGAPNQVKLRMIEPGVCGTDREICAFEWDSAHRLAATDHRPRIPR
jgi:glucose 1-dehydrogenase